MKHGLAWALSAAALLAAHSTSAREPEPGLRQIPARIELHPILTATLTDQQFLTGALDGTPVIVSGKLSVAQGSGRRPVVVLVHGSGGMGPNIDMWTRELNAIGISTFAIDGFTGRGLVSVSTDQARLGRLNLVLDSYRALEVLARHPLVDPERIALMGFSRGGQAALFASVTRFHAMWNKSGAEFAAYVPFYPDCMTTYMADGDTVERPIRLFHGAPDDYNPVAPCRVYVERLREARRDVTLTEYPNAQHAFDNPLGSPTPAVATNSQTVRACTIREEAPGLLINAATRAPFTYKDDCIERDPHIGHDPVATEAAKQAVKAFFRQVFRME